MPGSLENYENFFASEANLLAGQLFGTQTRVEKITVSASPERHVAAYYRCSVANESVSSTRPKRFPLAYRQMRFVEHFTEVANFEAAVFLSGGAKAMLKLEAGNSSVQALNSEHIVPVTFPFDGDANFIKILYTDASVLRDSDIADAIKELSKLLSRAEFGAIDTILDAILIEKLSIVMMITLLRTSFAARGKLRNWHPFLMRAAEGLRKRDRDPKKVLRGMYEAQ